MAGATLRTGREKMVTGHAANRGFFLDSLTGRLPGNSRLSASGEVARIAHKLVGSSVSCGVDAFTRSLRELERLGHEGDLAGAPALLDDVRNKFPRVQSVFSQFIQTFETSVP